MTKWPLILAVLFACLQIAPAMIIFWFIIGVGHFGFVSGPGYENPLRWVSYFLFTVPATVVFAAYRIRSIVEKKTNNHLTLLQSLVTVIPAILAIHIAESIITLYQVGKDETIFITAVIYGLISLISLSYLFASPAKEEVSEDTSVNFNKTKNIIIVLITFCLFIISIFIQLILLAAIEDFLYLEVGSVAKNPGFLTPFLLLQLILLPFFIIFARFITPKLLQGFKGFLLLFKVITIFTIHFIFILQALAYFSPQSIFKQAEAYFNEGSYESAVSIYRSISRYYPNFAAKTPDFNSRLIESYKFLAKYYEEQGEGYYYAAKFYLEDLIELDPNNLGAYDDLGRVHVNDGNYQDAIEAYKKGLQVDFSKQDPKDIARVYENLGLAYYEINEPDNAIDAFKKAIQYDPEQSTIYINLCAALLEIKNKAKEAEQTCSKGLKLDPSSALTHNNLGYALALQGRVDEAISEFKKALEFEPDLKIAKENLEKYTRVQK